MTTYLISDIHFSHKNIILYSQRPYSSIREMNESIINNWNAIVKSTDEVWHLGDFAFCTYPEFKAILKQLNGNIHCLLGNHDKLISNNQDDLLKSGLIKSIGHYKELKYNGEMFVLFHYPIKSWNKKHYGSIHCFGHVHNKLPGEGLSLDVGIDSDVITSEYRPVSLDEIIKWAKKHN